MQGYDFLTRTHPDMKHPAMKLETAMRLLGRAGYVTKVTGFANRRGGNVKLKPLAYLVVSSLLMAAVPTFGHHGTGVAYETEKTVTVKGTVVEWIWANPHCGLLFDATDENGNIVHWGAELGNPHQESGAGFSKDSLKPGDAITVTGHPSRSGAPRMTLSKVVLPDGHELPDRHAKGNGEAEPEN